MLKILQRLGLLLFILTGKLCPAAGSRLPPPDKENLQSIRLALEDDIHGLLRWAEQELRQVTPQNNPKAWIHLIYAEAATQLSLQIPHSSPASIAEAARMAKEREFYEAWILLQEVSMGVSWDAGESDDEEKKFTQLTAMAREHKLPHLEARYLALQGYVLMAKGDYDKGLQPMMEAMNALQLYPEIDDLDRMNIKSALAQAFASHSDIKRAMAMDQEIVEFARRKGLRGMLATSLHNIAGYYEEQGESKMNEAKAYYQEALQLGHSLHGHYTVGPCLIGLSAIARRQNQPTLALEHALEAVKNFKEPIGYWRAEAWFMAAEAQLDQKLYPAALQSLSEAEKANPPDLQRMLLKIHYLRSVALEKTGQVAEALASLKKHLETSKLIKKNEAQASYSNRLAQLGVELEQEKNQSLVKENELQSQKLKSAERIQILTFGLLALSVGVLILLALAFAEAREIRRRKHKMQRILDHIDEGILTINDRLQIEGEHSQYLLQFLGVTHIPPQSDAVDVLFQQARMNPEQRSMVQEILRAAMGETPLSWELNESHLPRQLVFDGSSVRTAALHWVPIFDKNSQLRRILLSLRDVTERVKLQAALDRKEQEVAELLDKDLALCHRIIDSCAAWLESNANRPTSAEALRQLHTIKGNARSAGLWQISQAIHQLESETTSSGTDHLSTLIAEYKHLLNDIFHRQTIIPKQPQYLSDLLSSHLPNLTERLIQSGFQLESVIIRDAVIHWPSHLLRGIADMIMHALNNSIDHGFLRQAAPQSRKVQLEIHARSEAHHLCLEILDNGAGLNQAVIQKRARELNLVSPTQDPFQVLFEDGFSTAADLTESSGRGMGLSAIAALSRQWNGSVRISPRSETRGTALEIRIPLEQKSSPKGAA